MSVNVDFVDLLNVQEQQSQILIMKKILSILFVALVLSGCASPQQSAQMQELKRWQAQAKSDAESGRMKWSAYYSQLWERLNVMPPDPQKTDIQQSLAEIIPIARQYESGQISKEQFEDTRRLLQSRSMQTAQNRRIAQQQIDAVQSQQQLQLSRQLLEMGRPQMLAPSPIPFPQTTNCTSRYNRIGNTVQTTCD